MLFGCNGYLLTKQLQHKLQLFKKHFLSALTIICYFCPPKKKRGARVVEGARLESGYTGNCIEGSNPFLSAYFLP